MKFTYTHYLLLAFNSSPCSPTSLPGGTGKRRLGAGGHVFRARL